MTAPPDPAPVSVVIPTYNGAAFLGEALESVFAQTLLPAEVVVVDDASTDGTPELVESKVKAAPVPVRLLRLTQNSGGPSRPLNVGVALARGSYVAVLDQDDVLAPRKLECQFNLLWKRPELRAAGSYCASHSCRAEPLQNAELTCVLQAAGVSKSDHWYFEKPDLFRLLIRHGNFLMGYPGFLFLKAEWKRKGGADESLRISSDYDLLCWLALQGPIALVPEIQYFRRDHPDNLCKRDLDVYIDTLRVKARYLTQERWLLEDAELARELREEMFGLAYWLRKAGCPWQALRYCRLSQKLWGFDRRTLWLMAKLLPQGLLGPVGRRLAGQRG